MQYVKNWLHCAWGTKDQVQCLSPAKKNVIMNHIRTHSATRGIYIDMINGGADHLHCIILLDCNQTLSKIMQVIREESTNWINKNRILKEKFEWDNDYYGLSFSTSHFAKVSDYLQKQEQYHKLKTWNDECIEMMKYYDFSKCNV